MPLSTLISSFRSKTRRYRSQSLRRLLLLWMLARRLVHRMVMRATHLGGWVWLAAGSLIGFEAFDIIFGTFALAPRATPTRNPRPRAYMVFPRSSSKSLVTCAGISATKAHETVGKTIVADADRYLPLALGPKPGWS